MRDLDFTPRSGGWKGRRKPATFPDTPIPAPPPDAENAGARVDEPPAPDAAASTTRLTSAEAPPPGLPSAGNPNLGLPPVEAPEAAPPSETPAAAARDETTLPGRDAPQDSPTPPIGPPAASPVPSEDTAGMLSAGFYQRVIAEQEARIVQMQESVRDLRDRIGGLEHDKAELFEALKREQSLRLLTAPVSFPSPPAPTAVPTPSPLPVEASAPEAPPPATEEVPSPAAEAAPVPMPSAPPGPAVSEHAKPQTLWGRLVAFLMD